MFQSAVLWRPRRWPSALETTPHNLQESPLLQVVRGALLFARRSVSYFVLVGSGTV